MIINSIRECYIISKSVYFRNKKFIYPDKKYYTLFKKYRGLVGPAREFEFLHSFIEEKIGNKKIKISQFFHETIKNNNSNFEKLFFDERQKIIKNDFDKWILLNPLTYFGKSLINRNDLKTFIITTKNKAAALKLLSYYKIPFTKLYSNKDIKSYNSKGMLIVKKMLQKRH